MKGRPECGTMLSYTFLVMLSSPLFYNEIASEYKNYCKASHVNIFLESDIALLEKYMPKSVLEFGVGDGRFAREFLKRNKDVIYVGVDNSRDMLMRASDSGALLVYADFAEYIEKLASEKIKFDCVVAPYTVMHHVSTLEQLTLFENMKRVGNIVIINCMTQNEEEALFAHDNKTIITFLLLSGKRVETMVYKINETIRKDTVNTEERGGREYLLYNKKI